jgi:hypothetical protein
VRIHPAEFALLTKHRHVREFQVVQRTENEVARRRDLAPSPRKRRRAADRIRGIAKIRS